MDIHEHKHGAVLVLKPAGPIVQHDAAKVKEAALRAASRNLGRVVLDASEVPFVDSLGIEVLVDLTEQFGQGGKVLKLSGTSETTRQALELTGWGDAFEYFDDVNEAVRSFL